MNFSDKCKELLNYPKYFIQTDLIELESRFLNELIKDARELYNNMRTFEKYCASSMSGNVYNFIMSMYHFALLKLSTVLEDKLRGSCIEDELIQHILRYYTQDEKTVLRELEKFSKLDPNITPPEVLADVIVAEEGEIYKLVREAISKEYVDLGRVLKTWESELKIRGCLTRAFISVYQARFNNVIKAIQLLLDQQPGWFKRLFKEYENIMLESADGRKEFEKKFKEVFSGEIAKLEDTLRDLEEENNRLRERLEELSFKLVFTEDESKKRDEELSRIRLEYESLRNRYESVLKDLNEKLTEMEVLKKELLEKEQELEKIKASQESSQAEKLTLENEIIQLRKTISDYEGKIQDYRILECRIKELESALKDKETGNLVGKEEVEYYYEVVAGRARRMLEDNEVKVFDPRSSDYRTIRKWDMIDKQSSSIGEVANPMSVKSITFTKLTGFLSKKKDIVIEYAFLTHFINSSHKEFDAQPIGLSEFTVLLRDRIREAEKENYYHILVVFSPTGFTTQLVNYVAGDSVRWTSIASRYSTIYLVDMVKGSLYHNPNDPVAKNNRFLANLELSEEQVERVVNYLSSHEARLEAVKRNPTVNFLSINDIGLSTGINDKLVLRRALSILEEGGVGKVRRIGNEIVFEYKTP